MFSMFDLHNVSQDKYNLALKKIQDEKDSMLPTKFQHQYKKAFFEMDRPSQRLKKHALAIVDPRLGDNWWRYV